jgi:hypothetical protein
MKHTNRKRHIIWREARVYVDPKHALEFGGYGGQVMKTHSIEPCATRRGEWNTPDELAHVLASRRIEQRNAIPNTIIVRTAAVYALS